MTAWRDALGLFAVSCAYAGMLAALVFALEWGSRFLPAQPWTLVPVTA